MQPKKAEEIKLDKLLPEDKWLLARTSQLIKDVSEGYANYNYPKAVTAFSEFVLEDLSRTYIKLIRERVGTETGQQAQDCLNYCLNSLLGLICPVTPHIAEYVYQNLRTPEMPESVHLNPFPETFKAFESEELLKEMNVVKDLAQNALALREENKLRLRWPLNELVVETKEGKLKHLAASLGKMCNVKQVTVMDKEPQGNFAKKELKDFNLHLSLEADERLKDEWLLRELVRKIQDKRKTARLNPHNIVQLWINCSDPLFLETFKDQIEKETKTVISIKDGPLERLVEEKKDLHRINKDFFLEIKK